VLEDEVSDWQQAPMGKYLDRWLYRGPGNHALRILMREGENFWRMRFDPSNNGVGAHVDQQLPPGLSLEEAKAMAIVLWRTR
jgi:hypothetical protein